MSWELMLLVVPVGTVAWMSYQIGSRVGWDRGYDVGRVSYHAEVEYNDELSDCGANERDLIMEAREDERAKTP